MGVNRQLVGLRQGWFLDVSICVPKKELDMKSNRYFIMYIFLFCTARCFAAQSSSELKGELNEPNKPEIQERGPGFDPFAGIQEKPKLNIETTADSNGIKWQKNPKIELSEQTKADSNFPDSVIIQKPAPADKPALEVTEEEQNILINFPENVCIETVIQYVSRRLNINIVHDESLKKHTVTISSPAPISKQHLLGLLKSILQFKGFTLIELQDQKWYKVVEAKDLTSHTRSLKTDSDANSLYEDSTVISQVFSARYITTKKLEDAIKPFLSGPAGSIVSFPEARLLIVTDFASNIQTARKTSELVDVGEAEHSWRFFKIKHVPVQKLASDIESVVLLAGDEKNSSDSTFAKIAPLPQISTLAAAGRAEQIGKTEQLIAMLDVEDELVTEFLTLNYISSQQAKQLLIAALGMQSERTEDERFTVFADQENNRLIVTCDKDEFGNVKNILYNNIDIEPHLVSPELAHIRIYKLKNVLAPQIAITLKSVFRKAKFLDSPIESESEKQQTEEADTPIIHDSLALDSKDIESKLSNNKLSEKNLKQLPQTEQNDLDADTPVITIDKNTNSLIVAATAPQHKIVGDFVKKLDHRRPQILAEVMLVAINSSDSLELGVELQNLEQDSKDFDSTLFTSFGLSTIDATTGKRLIGSDSGFIGALIRPDEVPIILHALKSRTNANVFAAPKLLVMDNSTATLSSVTETPFTSLNASDTVATTSFAGYAEAGTQLAISAHTAEGDYVELEYRITSSTFSDQLSSSDIPPPRTRDELHSRVCVPDGYTLIVGGLRRETLQGGINSVPLLGDLPLVGVLFRNQNNSKTYNTLYVFIKPIILRDDNFADLKFLSDEDFKKVSWPDSWPDYEWIYVR